MKQPAVISPPLGGAAIPNMHRRTDGQTRPWQIFNNPFPFYCDTVFGPSSAIKDAENKMILIWKWH